MSIKQCPKFMLLKWHVMTCLLEKNIWQHVAKKKTVSTTTNLSRGRAKVVLHFFEFFFLKKLLVAVQRTWFVNREVKEKLGKVKWELGCVMQGKKKADFWSSCQRQKSDSGRMIWVQGWISSSSQKEIQEQHQKGNAERKSSNSQLKTQDSWAMLREIPVHFCTPQHHRLWCICYQCQSN